MRRRKSHNSNEGWLTSYADLITNLLIFFALIISASKIQTGKMEQISEALSEGRSVESLSEAAKKIKKRVEEEKLQDNVRVVMTDEGLELVFDSGVVFSSGSAEILTQMKTPLDKVLEVLKPYSQKYMIAVEGHTDEVPMKSGRFKSNWELSSGRAMKIRESLEGIGAPKNKIRVESYADTKPLKKDLVDGLTRAEFLAKHRRVVIRLY